MADADADPKNDPLPPMALTDRELQAFWNQASAQSLGDPNRLNKALSLYTALVRQSGRTTQN